MFQVSQSATGQFVVTHPPSNTVIVGDDLVATYEQMRALVGGLGEAARAASASAPAPGLPGSSTARWISLAALALLPFVWLGALHVSLGRLVAELRLEPPAASGSLPGADLRARVERTERQIETLERMVTRTPAPVGEPQADQAEQQAEQAGADEAPDGQAEPDKRGGEKPDDPTKTDDGPTGKKKGKKKGGKARADAAGTGTG